MAEALINARIVADGSSSLEVCSAGIDALAGRPAANEACILMRTQGLDLSPHRARNLTAEMMSWADLVLVMEQSHVSVLHDRFPAARGKVFRLGHWLDCEIPDPYMAGMDAFRAASDLIREGIATWLPHLQEP